MSGQESHQEVGLAPPARSTPPHTWPTYPPGADGGSVGMKDAENSVACTNGGRNISASCPHTRSDDSATAAVNRS